MESVDCSSGANRLTVSFLITSTGPKNPFDAGIDICVLGFLLDTVWVSSGPQRTARVGPGLEIRVAGD